MQYAPASVPASVTPLGQRRRSAPLTARARVPSLTSDVDPTFTNASVAAVQGVTRAAEDRSAVRGSAYSPYLGNYVTAPPGLRMAGEQMRADTLSRLARIFGVDTRDAVSYHAAMCVMFAYINWCLDDRMLDYARAMPFEWSEEDMADLPIAERLRAYGLDGLYSVAPYDLFRWVESDMEDLVGLAERGDFDGIFPRMDDVFESPIGTMTKAASGKVLVDEPQVFPHKEQALPIFTSNHGMAFGYRVGMGSDAIHTISARDLANIMGVAEASIEAWLDPEAPEEVSLQAFQSLYDAGFGPSAESEATGRALINWIDSSVANYLSGSCAKAYKAAADNFPRFSTVFDIYDVLITASNEPGYAVILAKVKTRRDHPVTKMINAQFEQAQQQQQRPNIQSSSSYPPRSKGKSWWEKILG
ncbi:hypothetical protein [Mollivirus kamchatka]|nr:hypothetical protein [Mollivirus kamchatka]